MAMLSFGGIDVSKDRLDVMLLPEEKCASVSNDAADQHDEGTSLHSITSSARASSVGGTVRPRALAVFRLTMVTSFVGNSTGKSAGLLPLRILSTKSAARR